MTRGVPDRLSLNSAELVPLSRAAEHETLFTHLLSFSRSAWRAISPRFGESCTCSRSRADLQLRSAGEILLAHTDRFPTRAGSARCSELCMRELLLVPRCPCHRSSGAWPRSFPTCFGSPAGYPFRRAVSAFSLTEHMCSRCCSSHARPDGQST